MPEKVDFIPITKNKTKKTSQARIPSPPVVAIKVGNKPEPESKEVSQNWVLFMDCGLYIDHAAPKLFGPMPNMGFLASTPFATDVVAAWERLISLFDICK